MLSNPSQLFISIDQSLIDSVTIKLRSHDDYDVKVKWGGCTFDKVLLER